MDPESIDNLIKAAPTIAKGAGAVAAAFPFTAIVKQMIGPAADELAEMWRDQVRMYRYERQMKCVEKAERMAREAGFKPQPVPPKILFPLLDGASREDSENLHDMWAALLANAASPDNAHRVRPAFIKLLTEMAPDEAGVLNMIFENGRDQIATFAYLKYKDIVVNSPRCGDEDNSDHQDRIDACLYALIASGLIERDGGASVERKLKTTYRFTGWGNAFLQACTPPRPTQK